MDHLCYLCLVFVKLLCTFIAALWSLARKELTYWLSLMMLNCVLSFTMWYHGSGVALDCIDC